MRGPVRGVVFAFAAVLVAACGDTRAFLGLDREPPDEFAVYSRAPLSLPPDYGLRPPEPGRERPQLVTPRDEARSAVTGREGQPGRPSAGAPSQASPGTLALLKQLNAVETDPDIRATVNRETTMLAEESRGFADRILFWRETAAENVGMEVDAAKEAKRIQETRALGRPLTEGETPIIERKKKGLLEGVF
jgi:hypothetical protein